MGFKKRIKQLREEKELTHSQLAAIFGKSEGAIRSWEMGRSNPDIDTVIKLAGHFDCTADYLLGLSDIRNQEEKDNLTLVMTETDSLYSDLKEEYKIRFQEIISPILFTFYLVSNDEEHRNKELFIDYNNFLEHVAIFYNSIFGVFSAPVFYDEYENTETRKSEQLLSAFELREKLEDITFRVLNFKKSDENRAQFSLDYEAYKKYDEELRKEDGENNATEK